MKLSYFLDVLGEIFSKNNFVSLRFNVNIFFIFLLMFAIIHVMYFHAFAILRTTNNQNNTSYKEVKFTLANTGDLLTFLNRRLKFQNFN